MIVYILAVLDIIAGVAFGTMNSWTDKWLLLIGLVILIKGFYSVTTGLMGGWYFEFMGWIDIVAGILILVHVAWAYMWLIMIVKGIYSVAITKIMSG